jgi:hypothetical protein
MILVYFVDLILCRPFHHATLASLMQASSFYSFHHALGGGSLHDERVHVLITAAVEEATFY